MSTPGINASPAAPDEPRPAEPTAEDILSVRAVPWEDDEVIITVAGKPTGPPLHRSQGERVVSIVQAALLAAAAREAALVSAIEAIKSEYYRPTGFRSEELFQAIKAAGALARPRPKAPTL